MRAHAIEPAPPGWTVAHDQTVAHPSDRAGAEVYTLVRNDRTGLYGLLRGGAIRSCPQPWARQLAGERRKPGPKPKLADPARLTVIVEQRQLDAVDAYAAEHGTDRSKAARELLARGLDTK